MWEDISSEEFNLLGATMIELYNTTLALQQRILPGQTGPQYNLVQKPS